MHFKMVVLRIAGIRRIVVLESLGNGKRLLPTNHTYLQLPVAPIRPMLDSSEGAFLVA